MNIKTVFRLIIIIIIGVFWSCNKDNDSTSSETGVGGSMARFIIIKDYLYTIDNNKLIIFNINNPNDIQYTKSITCLSILETVFVKDSTLFIGSRDGMYIYDISNPENPTFLSEYLHVYSCDPVVVDSSFAFVTLHSKGNRCGTTRNSLEIIDIKDRSNPVLVKSYKMTSPRGLGIDSNFLFICDQGLKVYDKANVLNLVNIASFNILANDVIPSDSVLIVTADDGLYQYKYKNKTITLLSKIGINQ